MMPTSHTVDRPCRARHTRVTTLAARTALLVLAALPVCGQTASTQPTAGAAAAPGERNGVPRGTFGESIDVRVIDVEVVVTDADGNRVTGLTRDDFRLLVNGRETPLAFFDEVWDGHYKSEQSGGEAGAETPGGGEEPVSAPAPATYYLVILDDYFTRPAQRNRVLGEVKDQLHLLQPQDRFAAVAYDGRRLTVLSDWTGSLADMDAALDAAKKRGGWRAFQEQVSARDNPQRLARVVSEQLERTYAAVAAALRTFSEAPGRRVALLVAGGWPYELRNPDNDLTLARSRLFDTRTPLRSLGDLANAAGYTLYPVDAPGARLVPGASAEYGERTVEERFGDDLAQNNEETSLLRLAEATGGRALLDESRLSALERVVEDTRSYYWLGFEYRRQGDGGRRGIQVEVTRPGLTVRSRRSFLDVSPLVEGALTAERALLLGTDDEPTLTVELGEAKRAGAGKVQQPFAVRIPFDEVTVGRGPKGPRLRLELRVAVEDGKGGRSDLTTLPLKLDLPPGMLERGFAWYDAAVKLRRRKHVLVFTLTDQATGTTLVARHEVDPR
jgi:VWFA-related protein